MVGVNYKILRYTGLLLIFLFLISCDNDEDTKPDTKASFEAIVDGESVSLIENDSISNPDTYINMNCLSNHIAKSNG